MKYNIITIFPEAFESILGHSIIKRALDQKLIDVAVHDLRKWTDDERGTVEYNLALGEKRAQAVRDYLVNQGVPSSQLRLTSYGEERPFARGGNESAWALNRRAHFSRP